MAVVVFTDSLSLSLAMLGVLITPWLLSVLTTMKFISINHLKTSGRGYISSKREEQLTNYYPQFTVHLFFYQIISHTTMGNPHDVKSKGSYHIWSDPESKTLLRLLVDGINQGFRDCSGKFNKLTVEKRILPVLNQKLGTEKNYTHYKNRMKILKNRYQNLSSLLRFSSGYGWDPETKKITAPDEVWNDYFVAHPKDKHMRDDSFEDFEDLRMVFESNIATGQNAMGLGDPINADTYQVEENVRTSDSNHVQMMDNGERIPCDETFDNVVFPLLEKSMGEKLHQRKKARTEAFNFSKNCDEVTEIGHHIFGMIQKRWEKESEEKEAEDKANNVWDAIKEIPDLDEDLRYEAMTLVHSLGMKSGFVNMSVAKRNGWIQRSLRKP